MKVGLRWGVLLVLAASWARAETMCVSTTKANVREGAGTEYPVSWVAARYTPFATREWVGEWVNVRDVDDDTGWVHQSVLSSGLCVSVAGKRANIRSGPGMEHEALWEVEHGYAFEVLRKQAQWLQVSDGDEVEGWIHKSLIWGNDKPEVDGEI